MVCALASGSSGLSSSPGGRHMHCVVFLGKALSHVESRSPPRAGYWPILSGGDPAMD